MKYRHSYHAGNFADVHKHIALLALMAALQKKEKGFLCLDTHAGRGGYDLSGPAAESAAGFARLCGASCDAAEIRAYLAAVDSLRERFRHRFFYGGSPLLIAATLRAQDRAVLIEQQGGEAHALKEHLATLARARGGGGPAIHVERGDGYARLKAYLPPPERRGLTLLDPPYEAPGDFAAVGAALAEGLRRFPRGVMAAWYPIKEERTTRAWLAGVARELPAPLLSAQLWLFPRDSRVALNGSGLLVANPPHLFLERAAEWQRQLVAALSERADAGSSAQMVSESHQ